MRSAFQDSPNYENTLLFLSAGRSDPGVSLPHNCHFHVDSPSLICIYSLGTFAFVCWARDFHHIHPSGISHPWEPHLLAHPAAMSRSNLASHLVVA
jgi:hypothetical protein